MKIKENYGEDGNSSDMNSFSVSEKFGFVSPTVTTFQISGKVFFYIQLFYIDFILSKTTY